MTQTELNSAIEAGLNNLFDLNVRLFEYWYSELYTYDDNVIDEAWNEQNLKLIENDVMNESLLSELN
jgi:hypothetical protein